MGLLNKNRSGRLSRSPHAAERSVEYAPVSASVNSKSRFVTSESTLNIFISEKCGFIVPRGTNILIVARSFTI